MEKKTARGSSSGLERLQAGCGLSPELLAKRGKPDRAKKSVKSKRRKLRQTGTICRTDNPLLRAVHAAFMSSGLNSYELEERSGVARNTVSYWFNKESNWPNLRHLFWVVEALGYELVLRKKDAKDV